jgi:hypothetical protein
MIATIGFRLFGCAGLCDASRSIDAIIDYAAGRWTFSTAAAPVRQT